MATSLGSLVVSLGLNAAEYIAGLTVAERQAQKFAKNLDKGIASAANAAAIGIGLITTAAAAAAVAVDQLVKGAANFQDMSEITGASAESLASFAVAAATANTEMSSVAEASVKLTKNLTGVDDESKAAGAALAALGLNIKQFKALDPATQMETVAKALAGFADGASKTAVAVALLGKSGAQLLPFLKELGAEGGRQVILTQRQIELADQYADKQAAAAAQLRLHAQALATELIPAFTATTKAATEFIKGLVGVKAGSDDLTASNAIQAWAERAAKAIAFVVDAFDGLIRVGQEAFLFGQTAIAQMQALADKDVGRIVAIGQAWKKEAQAILMRPLFSTKVEEEFAKLKKFGTGEFVGPPKPLPDLKFSGAVKDGGKAAKQTDDAKRYLEALTKTLERTQDLTAAEQLLVDIREGRFAGFTDKQLKEAQALAAAEDGNKAQAKAIKEANDKQKDAIRVAEQAAEAQKRANEARMQDARQIEQANLALSDEIAFIRGGEEALKQIERTRILNTIATNENTIAQLKLNKAREGEIEGLRLQNAEWEKRLELLKDKDVAIALRADADAMQALADTMSDSFADAFEGFVMGTKSASNAFKDFANDIQRYLLRISLQKLGDQMFGGQTSGQGDLFGALFKSILGMFGGGSGGGYGQFSLNGAAAGTNFAWGGPTVVGENGPEIVDMPRGARVWPNGTGPQQSAGDSIHMENHFHVQGTINSQTVRQIERGIGDSVARNRIDR